MSGSEAPFVSVIIPVFNDGDRLRLCLAALAEQTYEQSHFEIIVIDNGSDDGEFIQSVVAPYDNLTLTVESAPGSYAARNQGLTLAKGEILAFTDADCIPAPDWIEQGVEQLQSNPSCGQVLGQIQIFFTNPQRPTPVELYESITAFPQERLLQQFRGGATANLFTWRSVVDAVGPFDAQLKSNGDVEWGQRVYAQGYQQIYAASVLVQHPARSSIAELYSRTRRLVGGRYDLQLKRAQTGWQRQAVFIQTLLQYLLPPIPLPVNPFAADRLKGPILFSSNPFSDDRLSSFDQKIKVTGVMILVRLISAWETLRLKLGSVSSRA